jgi:hypothetical protein
MTFPTERGNISFSLGRLDIPSRREVEDRVTEPSATASRARANWAARHGCPGAYNYDGTGNIYTIGTAASRQRCDEKYVHPPRPGAVHHSLVSKFALGL